MANNASARNRARINKKHLFNVAFIIFIVLIITGCSTTYVSLRIQLDTIKDQNTKLLADSEVSRLNVLKMQRVIEYSKMDEYIDLQANDKLGFVHPGDIKFVQETDE